MLSKERVWNAFLILKYFFSVFLTYLVFTSTGDGWYLLISLLELAVIILTSHAIFSANRIAGHIVHFVLLLVYNIQTAVMYFGGTFVSLIMVTNITLFSDLHGNFGSYVLVAIPIAICTLIPIKKVVPDRKHILAALACAIVVETILLATFGTDNSPISSVFNLYSDWNEYRHTNSQVEELDAEASDFYNPEIGQYIDKPEILPDKPNVVLIFLEGISQSLLYDDRDIMPNLYKFQSETVHFEDYYNHSFATLRGIIGQLYSGYQLNNLDTNSLASMQSILRQEGYHTAFVNTEPTEAEWTEHVSSFQFDELVTDMDIVDTSAAYIHDKDAFDLLYRTISEQHESGVPFFAAMYTFGTHVSLDSPDEKYGDGSSAMLNKFYNTDFQFGEFLRKFKESELFEDTILIVTTDHATYVDEGYLSTFPNQSRQYSAVDKIPLCIYYKGVTPESINVNGRNSICLAPTILDYLDISAPNYFLGASLFSEQANPLGYDTIFHYPSLVLTTDSNEISKLTEDEYAKFMDMLVHYSAAKGDPSSAEISLDYVSTVISDDCATLTVTLISDNDYDNIWFPVWSEEYNQDDLMWYQASKNEDGNWSHTVNLSKHNSKGTYLVDVYAGVDHPEEKVASTSVSIPDYPPFHIESEISTDASTVTFTLTNVEESYTNILFPVWSAHQDQDDLVWYHPERNDDGTWSCTVNVADHCATLPDKLIIHVYGERIDNNELEFLSLSSVEWSDT